MSVSSDMIKVTLINDLLGKYDIPFAQILAQSVAMHVENWSTEVSSTLCIVFIILTHS